MPEVSVILPAYNVEPFIGLAIESVIAQNYTDWELIIVDDASTDATLDISLKYRSDRKIRVLSNSTNQGVASTRNRGVAASSGRWISFLDGDDFWTGSKLLNQMERLHQHANQGVRLCYSFTSFVSVEAKHLHPGCCRIVESKPFLKLLTHNFIESGSNAILSRQLFEEIGGFNSFWEPAEDWQFFLEASKRTGFTCSPTADIYYRQRLNSASCSRQYQDKLECIAQAYLQQLNVSLRQKMKKQVEKALKEGRLYQRHK